MFNVYEEMRKRKCLTLGTLLSRLFSIYIGFGDDLRRRKFSRDEARLFYYSEVFRFSTINLLLGGFGVW